MNSQRQISQNETSGEFGLPFYGTGVMRPDETSTFVTTGRHIGTNYIEALGPFKASFCVSANDISWRSDLHINIKRFISAESYSPSLRKRHLIVGELCLLQ